jgi:hypothetical protein
MSHAMICFSLGGGCWKRYALRRRRFRLKLFHRDRVIFASDCIPKSWLKAILWAADVEMRFGGLDASGWCGTIATPSLRQTPRCTASRCLIVDLTTDNCRLVRFFSLLLHVSILASQQAWSGFVCADERANAICDVFGGLLPIAYQIAR